MMSGSAVQLVGLRDARAPVATREKLASLPLPVGRARITRHGSRAAPSGRVLSQRQPVRAAAGSAAATTSSDPQKGGRMTYYPKSYVAIVEDAVR